MNLEENVIKYKDITLTIIETVNIEEYERLDESFMKRQLVLDDISKIGYSKEEFKKLYMQYGIENLQNELTSKMKDKEQNLLEKIKDNKKRQAAVVGYNKLPTKAVFLSKEI
ncbi:hypothetical protein [Clostridium lacusfryxellense]|uniref:hypothetical protein n=1 Tax=Clostridium lacusfryxellense TaxID=205328 RepID=UPI001C0B8905|nr:hypothetical protein [Clostridium lacusfryxellense]MBU3111767.1 hypothetical protein [Clostridium lacusfryxellense]